MKITVLVENTSNTDLIAEHGLSFFIEYEDKKILLDAGTTDAFYKNAMQMNVSFDDLDAAVLSHGHYDHSGGFEALFENYKGIKVYAQISAMDSYYSGSGGLHEIGIPKEVKRYHENFILIDGMKEILNGVFLIPHTTENLDKIGDKAQLYKIVSGEILPDDFAHEQSLVFDTPKGIIIFNSCSHGDVENIMREVKDAFKGKRIYAYIGGFHMKGKVNGREICTFSDDEIDSLCDAVKRENMEWIYTGHCTGIQGVCELQKRLGEKVQVLTTGLKFDF